MSNEMTYRGGVIPSRIEKWTHNKRRPSVNFFPEGGADNPCPFYRAVQPAHALRRHLWQAFVTIDGVIWDDGKFGSYALDRPTDIAVIRRPIAEDGLSTLDLSEQMHSARNAGQRIYFDIDDDLFNLPPTNPAANIYKDHSLDALQANLDAADAVLCSTTGLAVSLSTHVSVPIHVCPNGIDPSLYPAWTLEHSPLRIGWLGPIKWRHDDLASIADWLVPFLNDRPHVEFWHMGGMPKDEMQAEDILQGYKQKIYKIPWVPFPCLGQSLEQVDVLIIPQRLGGVYESFANSRSPTSAMAAIATGCVVWATPIESYRSLLGSALPTDLDEVIDNKSVRRHFRREQRKQLSAVNLDCTAAAYERVFSP